MVERKVYGCYSVCQGNDERVFVQTEPLGQHYGLHVLHLYCSFRSVVFYFRNIIENYRIMKGSLFLQFKVN